MNVNNKYKFNDISSIQSIHKQVYHAKSPILAIQSILPNAYNSSLFLSSVSSSQKCQRLNYHPKHHFSLPLERSKYRDNCKSESQQTELTFRRRTLHYASLLSVLFRGQCNCRGPLLPSSLVSVKQLLYT